MRMQQRRKRKERNETTSLEGCSPGNEGRQDCIRDAQACGPSDHSWNGHACMSLHGELVMGARRVCIPCSLCGPGSLSRFLHWRCDWQANQPHPSTKGALNDEPGGVIPPFILSPPYCK